LCCAQHRIPNSTRRLCLDFVIRAARVRIGSRGKSWNLLSGNRVTTHTTTRPLTSLLARRGTADTRSACGAHAVRTPISPSRGLTPSFVRLGTSRTLDGYAKR
jgi:hypothetical protein